MASSTLRSLYRDARRADVGCVVGEDALSAWRAAKILRKWAALEDCGAVRLRAEFDEDWEPDCSCEDPKFINKQPDTEAFGSIGEFRLCDASDAWTVGSSVWGHVGYRNVLDWRENPYILSVMAETIAAFRDAWKDHVRTRCPHCAGSGLKVPA